MRIGQATAELRARLAALDNEGGAVREKVQLLEDAHTLQVVPIPNLISLAGFIESTSEIMASYF